MLRLAPHLHLAIEGALALGRLDVVVRHLAGTIEPGSTPVDALRLLALAARQNGDDDRARAILAAAYRRASSAGDLVGATDALRRLDVFGADSGPLWERLLSDIEMQGFAASPSHQEWLDVPASDADTPPDELLATLADAVCDPSLATHKPRPFDPVPLLSELPLVELRDALSELQLRVAPDGEMLAAASAGSPAWVTSGSVRNSILPATVRPGTLVLPDTETSRAHGPVRLLTMPRELWHALSHEPDLEREVDRLQQHARLMSALRECGFYRALSATARDRFLDAIRCVSVVDEVLIRRGRAVPGLFVMVGGSATVVDASHGSRSDIGQLAPGEVFGELDVLTGGGAEYDVEARGAAEVCVVGVESVRALLTAEPDARQYLVDLTERREDAARGVS